MKLYKFLMAAMSVGLMASCSNDDVPIDDTVTDGQVPDGYIALSINLPTDVGTPDGTRASDNDQQASDDSYQVKFEDGLASEYTVKNAWLILFEGSDESTATFSGAYDITPNWELDPSSQITTSAKIVQKVKGATGTNNFYALVVLNKPDEFTFALDPMYTPAGTPQNGAFYSLTIGGIPFTGTFADLQKTKVANGVQERDSKGLTMSNSPLTTQDGGKLAAAPSSVPVTTLATINHDNIFKTEAEAKAKPAAEVFVERLAAKVTVVEPSAVTREFYPGKPAADGGQKYKYTIVKWAIDNYNTASYFSRVLPSEAVMKYGYNGVYRFMGGTKVGGYNYYRLYWAEDINYDEATDNPALSTGQLTAASAINGSVGEENPQYCFENTFSTKYQDWRNTTRVVIKASLAPDNDAVEDGTGTDAAGTFYVLNGETEKVYKAADVDDLFKAQALKNDPLQQWASKNISGTLDKSNLTVTYSLNAKNRLVVTDVALSGYTLAPGGVALTTAELTALKDYLNATAVIDKYDAGVAYYVVRIKHFGDKLCPWSDAEHLGEPETTNYIYRTSTYTAGTYWNERYLGRYGVVRNNWYNVNVTGIKQLGKPYVPTIAGDNDGDTPDDEVDSYIAVKINILSWAKRTQNEVLK